MNADSGLAGRRVVVTGASGFIGANLVRYLIDAGALVTALVRPGTDMWRLEGITDIVVEELDVLHASGMKRFLHALRPEVVFNTAAPAGHPDSTSASERLFRISTEGTLNVLSAARGAEARRVVHFGSSLEYGRSDRAHSEGDVLRPHTERGVAKAAATLWCLQRSDDVTGVVIIRPFSVYGPFEEPSRFVATLVRNTLSSTPVDLTPPGFKRDFIYVSDVVDAACRAATAQGVAGEVINAGTGEQWLNEDVVQLVAEVADRPVRIRVGTYPVRPVDRPHWVADIRKARSLLGWEPAHSLRQGLLKTVEWMKTRSVSASQT